MKRFLMPDFTPEVAASAFVAAGAVVCGGVSVGARSSIWYGCVLRGDINHIRIGDDTNVQDCTVVHVADDHPVVIGDRVSIGHRALIHACEIQDETLVGMGAIIMDGCVIGARSIIAAGTLLTKHQIIPEGSLVMGSPGRIVRALSPQEQEQNTALAAKYVEVSRRYLSMGLNSWPQSVPSN